MRARHPGWRAGRSSRRTTGQATVEYMLAIAFLAVALGLAVAGLFRAMSRQTESLVDYLADDLEDGRAQ